VNVSQPVRSTRLHIARLTVAVATLCAVFDARTDAAGELREATINVAFGSPTRCEVDAAFTIDRSDGREIEHRLQVLDGASAELMGIVGHMSLSGSPTTIGRTQSLILRPPASGLHGYGLRYRVTHPAAAGYRCPLWLPTIATDGRSRGIVISVSLPDGAVPAGGGLPPLVWRENRGTARLGHIPAFVVVPYSRAGEAGPGWSISRVMDATAVAALACASALFLWRRRRW